jgi:hypothetical protein
MRPAVYNIPNEMINLPEAISMAGDFTLYGRRDSVEIIRDVNGKKVFTNVDLAKEMCLVRLTTICIQMILFMLSLPKLKHCKLIEHSNIFLLV